MPLRAPFAAPPTRGVPAFEPLRVRGGGGGRRLRQAVWRQRRALAAALALTAAVLGATGLGGGAAPGGGAAYGAGAGSKAGDVPERVRRPGRQVSAPVRIADAGAVRLLRPGDHVDVIAAGQAGSGAAAGGRVLAKGALVAEVPPPPAEGTALEGALIVLSVPRGTATALAGAALSSPLAVTLC
ncbi:hypothetical protein ACFVWY_20700 [Streptomyces sp. NPDC058195]|uniref:hypothetical protein n=1 Tax=Streptomyces sp. NPDC058195 TaxID=3346375 RepID=UPI0036E39EAB